MLPAFLWPRVPSDKPVQFSVDQFPDYQNGRMQDDAEGLPKLALQSCTGCGNPYHIRLDCRNVLHQVQENPQEALGRIKMPSR